MRKILCGVVICLVTSLVSSAASFDPGVNYRELKSDHFRIYYDEALESVAQRAAGYAEEAHAIFSPKYDWKPLGRTTVILTDNRDESNGFATVVPHNYVILYVPAPEPDSALGHYDNWLRLLITHEYLHIIHLGQVGGIARIPRALLGTIVAPNGALPAWLREGLAVYEESLQGDAGRVESSFSKMLVRTSVLNNDWPGIDVAEGFGWSWPKGHGRYLYGGLFVDWLANTYGEDKLIDYQRRSGRSLLMFMNNRHAKKVWGKRWPALWKEWQHAMRAENKPLLKQLKRQGLTKFETIADDGETLGAVAYSESANALVYSSDSPHRDLELRLHDLSDGSERVLATGRAVHSVNFDAAGQRIVYSMNAGNGRYRASADVFMYDIIADKTTRLTAGRRARHPSFSPDGKSLIYVVESAGTQQLVRMTIEDRKETTLPVKAGAYSRFQRPQYSPDGRLIAVSSFQGDQHDMYVYRANGRLLTKLTNDRAVDHSPVWDKRGNLYFVSDRTGIANIYRYRVGSGELTQVTNVQTGVAEPRVSDDGRTLYAQYYHGQGFDLRKTSIGRVYATVRAGGHGPTAIASADEASNAEYESSEYSPFGPQLLVPRLLQPGFVLPGRGFMGLLSTTASDPLKRHIWTAGGSYRSDAKYFGYFGSYTYNRYLPTFTLGVNSYAVDFGNVNLETTPGGPRVIQRLYEKRIRGYAAVGFPIKQHRFTLMYFMEDRDNIPAMTARDRSFFNFDKFAGLMAMYKWGTQKKHDASISTEKGHRVQASFAVTDSIFGSEEANEQRILAAEWREFIPLPWQHHVLAFRLKGGTVFGDQLVQGTFGLGGGLGEGPLSGGGSLYYFPLRGTPTSTLVGDRAALASLEYRLPIVSPQRGAGTSPFFVNNLHAAFFADYGNSWRPSTNGEFPIKDFLLGVGAELRGDFVLWHGLPMVGRLGYGYVVVNNDRVQGIADPYTRADSKFGNLILEVGTSF